MNDRFQVHDDLLGAESLDALAAIIQEDALTYFRAFYGYTTKELGEVKFRIEDTFQALASSPAGAELQKAGNECPEPVLALLLLYASFFERAGMFGGMRSVANYLPSGAWRNRVEMLYLSSAAADIRTHYTNNLGAVLQLFKHGHTQPLDAMILAKYILLGRSSLLGCGYSELENKFSQRVSSRLTDLSFSREMHEILEEALDPDQQNLKRCLDCVGSRIIEQFFDHACKLAGISLGEIIEPAAVPPEDDLSSITAVPVFLDNALFAPSSAFGAIYEQMPERVLQGLEADDVQNRTYLGTYLPRSYAESRRIFENLFTNQCVFDAFRAKREVQVLDIGSGTGGNLLGLLSVIAACGFRKPIHVVSIDGNADALNHQRQLLDLLQHHEDLGEITVEQRHVVFDTRISGFRTHLADLLAKTDICFDIVMAWKSLSESYHATFAEAMGLYRLLLETVAPHVSADGLVAVADLCIQARNQCRWLPTIMAREVAEYVQSNESRLEVVLPLSCAHWVATCSERECYTQRMFRVSHSRQSDDISKITYRILMPVGFARAVLADIPAESAYLVSPTQNGKACVSGRMLDNCGHLGYASGLEFPVPRRID